MKVNMKILQNKEKGMTLLEILIAMSIFVLIVIVLSVFQSDVFKLNRTIQNNLTLQQNAAKLLKPIVAEIRSASISNLGAYPIASASQNTLEFYADIDADGLKEKIRYFKEGGEFKKGVTRPTGDPYQYLSENEEIVSEVSGVVNGSEPIFEYFDETYNGYSQSEPLAYPIQISDIRMVSIKLILDADENDDSGPIEVSTQAGFRNLRND